MEPKVIIERHILDGGDGYCLQLVATVYLGRDEYRAYAPPKATGNPLDWTVQMSIRRDTGSAEYEVPGPARGFVIDAISKELLERPRPQIAAIDKIGSQAQTPKPVSTDRRKVFVVYGRNSKAREAVFDFLRAIDLAPMEWEQVIAATGKPSPFIGDALEKGFSLAQAAVVILTGDDVARIGKRYLKPDDDQYEHVLTPQPRPNVLFEGGMAMGKYPDRTVFVSIGSYRKFTDIEGRHIVHLSNGQTSRQALADRLRLAGCAVDTQHKTDWFIRGDFDEAIQDPDLATLPKVRLKMFRREAKEDLDATFKRKIWIEFRNESDECLALRQPYWKAGTPGIDANIRQGTFQIQLGSTWCPEKIGAAQINLPPGDLCRLWAAPDESLSMDEVKMLCRSDAQLGSVVLLANGEEISVPV